MWRDRLGSPVALIVGYAIVTTIIVGYTVVSNLVIVANVNDAEDVLIEAAARDEASALAHEEALAEIRVMSPIIIPVSATELMFIGDDSIYEPEKWRELYLSSVFFDLVFYGWSEEDARQGVGVADKVAACESSGYRKDILTGETPGLAGEISGAQFHPQTWKGLGYPLEYNTHPIANGRATADMYEQSRIAEWSCWHLIGKPPLPR